jgi:bifunctional non-homologous end joining protein LigD
LSELIPQNDIVKYVDHVEERVKEFFQRVEEQELEGIIAKEKDSIYIPDTRTKNWLKIPIQLMKEYVIVGYTESEHGRPFSRINNYNIKSLLVWLR